jgi:ElaB/YqjD/DUF883 family membrane-anchored ribosome-binding protein
VTEPLSNGSTRSNSAAAPSKFASQHPDVGLSDIMRDLSQLIGSVRSLMGNADVLLNSVLGSSADSAKQTGEHLAGRLGEQLTADLNAATESGKQARQAIHSQVKSGGKTAHRYVSRNPWQAVAIAAAVAAMVAYLMPRR